MAAATYYGEIPPSATSYPPEKEPLAHSDPVQSSPNPYMDEFGHVVKEDQALKKRIRLLRLIARVLAALLSIGVFIPIAMTMQKYLSTRNIFRDVILPDGTIDHRTAWAADSKSWPTFAYFGVAAISVLLNLVILVAYLRSIQSANVAAMVATTFTMTVMASEIGVWVASVVVYRYEKDTNGVSNDLWGWSCSSAAETIQKEFADVVPFNKYCHIQSSSWFIGLAQTAVAILSAVVLFLAMRRRGTKKRAVRALTFSQADR